MRQLLITVSFTCVNEARVASGDSANENLPNSSNDWLGRPDVAFGRIIHDFKANCQLVPRVHALSSSCDHSFVDINGSVLSITFPTKAFVDAWRVAHISTSLYN